MNEPPIAAATALLLLLLQCASAATTTAPSNTPFDSPRLAELSSHLTAKDSNALKNFWQAIDGTTPLIEPIPGEPHASWVTFLFEGDEQTRRVVMIGGPAANAWHSPMTRLGDTALWYRTVRAPNDTRCAYSFVIDWPERAQMDVPTQATLAKQHPAQPDPRNPQRVGVPWEGSVLELPEAPPEPWKTRHPGVPRGEVRIQSFKSKFLKDSRYWPIMTAQSRAFDVYTPPGFDPHANEPYPLLFLFDGNAYKDDSSMPLAIILDNLIAEKKIPPIVACFVYQTQKRDEELTHSPEFRDFIFTELTPWMREHYPVAKDPAHTIIGGLSYGGLMAAHCAHLHPELFGNVLSMSGSYPWFPAMEKPGYLDPFAEGWLPGEFVKSPRRDIRFYLAAGKFENMQPYSLLAENRRFRDILLCKGYDVQYKEFTGGHDATGWRSVFVDGMIALTQR